MPLDPATDPLGDRVRLQHMLEAARQARAFVTGRSRADLDTDAMLMHALNHAVQVIGEAASRVSEQGRVRVPGVPWPKVVGMRHRLVHGYWMVNLDLLWEVALRDLPPLVAALEAAFVGWPLPEPPPDDAAAPQ